MTPLQYIKIGFAIGLLALVAFGTWYTTSDHYERKIAEIELARQTAVAAEQADRLAAKQKYEQDLQLAGEQHAKDQLHINDLAGQLGRVRIHIPTGCGAMPQAGTAGADTNGASGVFSERVDEAFRHFQEGTGQLIQRCEQLNIDARQMNAVSR